MTKTEILNYNKQCAYIIGWLKQYNGQDFIEINSNKLIEWLPSNIYNRTMTGKYQFDLELCKFHSDWNWIHEIIESIEKLNYYTKNECIRNVNYFNIYELENNEVTFYGTSNSKKEAVVEAIDKFLKWHKQNKH